LPIAIDNAEQYFFERIQTLLDSQKFLPFSKDLVRICGVDASYRDQNVKAVASVINVNGELLEQATYDGRATFPYVPGLFFLREGPFATEAVRRLNKVPDLVCFDAHGLAHPRGMGLATICGMILDIPSIGISKSRLVGEITSYKVQMEKLTFQNKAVGFVTRNPKRFWSPGFSVSSRELESIILELGSVCVRSIAKSHESATASSC
jgi:deoxyribonuclease V